MPADTWVTEIISGYAKNAMPKDQLLFLKTSADIRVHWRITDHIQIFDAFHSVHISYYNYYTGPPPHHKVMCSQLVFGSSQHTNFISKVLILM